MGHLDCRKKESHTPARACADQLQEIQYTFVAGLDRQLRDAEKEVESLNQALARAEKARDFIAGKIQKLAAETLDNPEMRKAMQAMHYDAGLLELLKMVKGGWEKLRREGASDATIVAAFKKGWPEYDYRQQPTRAVGGSSPSAWIDSPGETPPTLTGERLVAETRRVLGIPAAGKGKSGTGSGVKPAAKSAAKSGETRQAKAAPARKPILNGEGRTFNPSSPQPSPSPSTSASAKATNPQADKRIPVADLGSLVGRPWPASDAGFTHAELEGAMSGKLRPHEGEGGIIGVPLRDQAGEHWAVVGGSVGMTELAYHLYPCHLAPRIKDIKNETWAQRRKRFSKKAPEDIPLGGLRVIDSAGDHWILEDDKRAITLTVPNTPAVRDAMAAAAGKAAGKTEAAGFDDDEVKPETIEVLCSQPGRVSLRIGRRGNGRYSYSAMAYAGKLKMTQSDFTGSYASRLEAANAGMARLFDFVDAIPLKSRGGNARFQIEEISEAIDKAANLVRDPAMPAPAQNAGEI